MEDRAVDGLVIDDFFVISRERIKHEVCDLNSLSSLALAEAKQAYSDHQLLGSDDKDVLGSAYFKVCGAEIVSLSKKEWLLVAALMRKGWH